MPATEAMLTGFCICFIAIIAISLITMAINSGATDKATASLVVALLSLGFMLPPTLVIRHTRVADALVKKQIGELLGAEVLDVGRREHVVEMVKDGEVCITGLDDADNHWFVNKIGAICFRQSSMKHYKRDKLSITYSRDSNYCTVNVPESKIGVLRENCRDASWPGRPS